MNSKYLVEDIDSRKELKNNLIDIVQKKEPMAIRDGKSFIIKCEYPSDLYKSEYRYLTKYISWNNADKKLPLPVNITTSVSVSCKIPSSLQIYLWKENEALLNYKTLKNIPYHENYIIRSGELYSFQVFAFDINIKPFFNFSSLDIKWNINRGEFGDLKDL